MTMVLKNSRFGTPEKNVGATLFVYKPRSEMNENIQNVANQVPVNNKDVANQVSLNNKEVANQDNEPEVQKPSASDMAECIAHNKESSREARKSRERRLMAHMGLKSKFVK